MSEDTARFSGEIVRAVNTEQSLPMPVHVISDGEAVDLLIVERLSDAFQDVTWSVQTSEPSPRSGARPLAWIARQHDLDGIGGVLRSARSKFRPGLRLVAAMARRKLARRSTSSPMGPPGTKVPVSSEPDPTGTLILLGTAAWDAEIAQTLRLHVGWPAFAGSNGIVSALTHRNVDALCSVVEATGRRAGWARAWPPLAEDDDVASLHRRVALLGAEMLCEVIDDPRSLSDRRPESMPSAYVDAEAVRKDVSSRRVAELIRAVKRF